MWFCFVLFVSFIHLSPLFLSLLQSFVKIRDAMYKPPHVLPLPTLPMDVLPKKKLLVPPSPQDPFNINISS